MRMAFPHMGNACIPLRSLVENLGAEPVVPERPHRGTLERGLLHAPEFACLPFKVTLGDCLNALDKGADTLAMVSGMWACRFGYYGRVQHMILRDLGYRFESVLFGGEEPREIWRKLKPVLGRGVARKAAAALAIFRAKAAAVEEIESRLRELRPREEKRGEADRLAARYLRRLDEADTLREVRLLRAEAREALDSVRRCEGYEPLRIRVVGELYVLLEPALNLDLVKRLGSDLRVEAQPVLSTYKWLLCSLWLDPRLKVEAARARRLTRPFLPYVLGGEEHMTVSGALTSKEDGFDGIIHAYPLTCMPENICRTLLPSLCRGQDLPLLELCFDEHTSPVGVATRLEAFIDLLRARRATLRRKQGAWARGASFTSRG